ncbi:MAG: hypothetical protein L3J36_11035 [Rhodobacteraceae bacterium]|nr:hypothetical protein [Paracoccaceae bacterium]
MSQIEEYQSRIVAAMERIGAGVAALDAQGAQGTGAAEALGAQLEEEKQANAQLEERLASLISKHQAELAAQKAELDTSAEFTALKAQLKALQAGQSEAMSRLDMDVQRMRQANDQLRASNAALRRANEQGVGEPHLINSAMLAELESLRASRATDSAEVSAVLDKLGPLLAGAKNLPEGEDA